MGKTVDMPRPKRNDAAAQELGAHLTALREALSNPPPSYDDISDAIRDRCGVTIKRGHLRQMHVGEVDPNSTKFEDLTGLVHYYGVEPKDLGPNAQKRIESVLADLKTRHRPAKRPLAMQHRRVFLPDVLTAVG